jgi:hypothetical protein
LPFLEGITESLLHENGEKKTLRDASNKRNGKSKKRLRKPTPVEESELHEKVQKKKLANLKHENA